MLIHLLKKAGLDPDKDVTIRNIPVSANIIPSYLEPNTQFAQAFEPMIVQALYKASQAEAEAKTADASGQSEDDVVDAEFEEVKDDDDQQQKSA